MYTGQSLDNLIRSVREKLDSNVPAEEFKVGNTRLSSIISTLCEVVKLFEFVEEDITECRTL